MSQSPENSPLPPVAALQLLPQQQSGVSLQEQLEAQVRRKAKGAGHRGAAALGTTWAPVFPREWHTQTVPRAPGQGGGRHC